MNPVSIAATRVTVMAALATLASTLSIAAAESMDRPVEFNRDIRPILSENCFLCHGPDKGHRKAKLRLDDRAVAVEKGAIVPGKPEKSELVVRINNPNPDDVMPPTETHKTLTPHQKELLTRWIAQGAEYQPHWSYLTPKKSPVPRVRNGNFKIQNPIDAFILSALDAKKIQPSPPADGAMLLRRVSLDLTGLPPTPEEVRAFLNDRSPRAYERVVDRLLASPRYGERMAVAWLDVARFADTVGYHGDQNQNIFPYRDYVINSFNRNKPFDQFTIEQLAGDLLPKPTAEQRVATGFNRLNMVTREGGAQPKEYLAKYAADRVRTVSTAWLGSTMGCAECHDHKFDPFSARDFYQMEAFFADIKQWGVYSDYVYTPNPDLKDWSNDHPFPPEMTVESSYLQKRRARLLAKIDDVETSAAGTIESNDLQRAAFDSWTKSSREFFAGNPDGWMKPAVFVPLIDDIAVVNADGSILFKGAAQKDDQHQIRFALPDGYVAALRLELLPDPSHKGSIARGGGNAATVQFTTAVERVDGKDAKIGFFQADSGNKQLRYANGAEIIGIKDVWKTDPKQATNIQTGIYLFDKPIKASAGDELVLTFKAPAIGRFRVALSPFSSVNPLDGKFRSDLASALGKPGQSRTGRAKRFIRDSYLLSTGWDSRAFAEFKKLQNEVIECRNGQAQTLVTEAWKPATTRVLARGNWQDESGDIVDPAPPHFLPQPKVKDDRRLTRLDLAKWLMSPDNPLTARTFVNRTWKQFFGNGLSAVVDDLGAQGEWPTHPELLDWLSVEFRGSGWDMKHLVRLIVLSSTYRQSSNLRPELREIDPNNRLLASQNPRRLEAEFVRDNALFVAGLLNLDLGGPSARPYQPGGYYANLQFPDRDYQAQLDDRQYRRGLYMHWQRTFLQPMLANFDAPGREECTAIRTVSNTPQQALTLLNDPSFVEASRVFAAKLLTAPGSNDRARIELAFAKTLARPPKPREVESLTAFLAEQRKYYEANPKDAEKVLKVGIAPAPSNGDKAELAAWTMVGRVILNLHETITRY